MQGISRTAFAVHGLSPGDNRGGQEHLFRGAVGRDIGDRIRRAALRGLPAHLPLLAGRGVSFRPAELGRAGPHSRPCRLCALRKQGVEGFLLYLVPQYGGTLVADGPGACQQHVAPAGRAARLPQEYLI